MLGTIGGDTGCECADERTYITHQTGKKLSRRDPPFAIRCKDFGDVVHLATVVTQLKLYGAARC
jgi:hypothetical protein